MIHEMLRMIKLLRSLQIGFHNVRCCLETNSGDDPLLRRHCALDIMGSWFVSVGGMRDRFYSAPKMERAATGHAIVTFC